MIRRAGRFLAGLARALTGRSLGVFALVPR